MEYNESTTIRSDQEVYDDLCRRNDEQVEYIFT